MSLVIDQLVFGYRDGHELLAASVDVDARLEAELLPHADARFEDESDHYLVGLWIAGLRRFMLTRIWPAPELPRPGAVWAHSLLLEDRDLKFVDPLLLLGLFRRPDGSDLSRYQLQIGVEGQTEKSHAVLPSQLVLALSEAAYEPATSGTVVIWPDGHSGEESLLAVWRGLPVPMRQSFSFRTRGRARTGSSRYAIQVATQMAGRSASQQVRVLWPDSVDPPNDIKLLAESACEPNSPLSAAVARYASTSENARFIAAAWPLIDSGDALSVLDKLESCADVVPPMFGESLFAPVGDQEAVWEAAEGQRIEALLHAHLPEYLQMLNLPRLESAWTSDRGTMVRLLDEREDLEDQAASLLLKSSINQLSVEEIIERVDDSELLAKLLAQRDDFLLDLRFWEYLEESSDPGLRDKAIVSAGPRSAALLIKGELWSLIDQALGHPEVFASVVEHLAQREPATPGSWERALKGHERELTTLLSQGPNMPVEVPILSAATLPGKFLSDVPLRRWLDAAPAVHRRQDLASSAAAARLIAYTYRRKESAARELLIECFGPAHSALEKKTLPPRVVAELERSLPYPKTKSLAKRLNRALIASMESSRWTEKELRRALENAGPEAHRLVKLVPKKNPLRRRIEETLHDLEDLLPLP